MSVTKTRKHRIKVSSHLGCRTNKYRLSVKSCCNLSKCNQMKQDKQRGGIQVLDAFVHSQNPYPNLKDLKFAFDKDAFEWTKKSIITRERPDPLTNILSFTRSTSQLEAHRDYTIKDLCEQFTLQYDDNNNINNIDGLLNVFEDVAGLPASEIEKKLNVSKETIDELKRTLSPTECDVIDRLKEFMHENNWNIPWVEKSTGRLLRTPRQPLFRQASLIDTNDVKLLFPIVVIQAQVKIESADVLSNIFIQKHIKKRIQQYTGTYVKTSPILLSYALTTLGKYNVSASVRVHRSRANGKDDYSKDTDVRSFGVSWLRQWSEKYPRLINVYLQLSEHTDHFPPLQKNSYNYPMNYPMKVCTNLHYSPDYSTYDVSTMNKRSISPSILDYCVPEGNIMYNCQRSEVFSCTTRYPDDISLYEYNRCVLPLKEGAGGETRAMTISQKKQVIIYLKPKLEPHLRTQGLEWADVPALETIDSVEELQEAIDDPVAFVKKLAKAGEQLTVEKPLPKMTRCHNIDRSSSKSNRSKSRSKSKSSRSKSSRSKSSRS